MRGNRLRGRFHVSQIWSIPACAGEPRQEAPGAGQQGVYPRMCGGTSLPQLAPSTQFREIVFSFPGQRSDLYLVVAFLLGEDYLGHLSWTKKQHTVAICRMPSDSIPYGLGESDGILYDEFAPEYHIRSLR